VVDTGAWIYFRKGEFEKARNLLVAAEDTAREAPIIQYHRGMMHLKLGEKEKARAYLSAALNSKADFDGRNEAEKALGELKIRG